jgi:pimeloyl-ACP methyl ester carboxylesterase
MRLLTLLFSITVLQSAAQFSIGHLSHTFIDPNRNNRQIPCEIYYPALTNGESTAAADGVFPVIVFGHGFVMGYDAYENLWYDFVPEGYIMAFATTEGGLAPSHQNFGLDLRFVSENINLLNTLEASVLFNHIAPERAIAGHSMGGGATWLAASGSSSVDCIVGLAPAETNPSAVSSGENVTVPALVLSGSADAVTPPDQHHLPIYEGTASNCKTFVNIIDGSHCYFANSGSLCDFGEFNPGDMSRETQQAITYSYMLPFFDHYLKGVDMALDEFLSVGNSTAETDFTTTCLFVGQSEIHAGEWSIYPNPFRDAFVIAGESLDVKEVILVHASGAQVPFRVERMDDATVRIIPEQVVAGMYFLYTTSGAEPVILMCGQ